MTDGRLEAVSVGIVVADCVARPVHDMPGKGQLALVESVGLYSGGSAATTGYSLARFGVPSAVIGRVGRDGFGDFLLSEATRHGVDSSLLIRDAHPTSATLVTVDSDGERSFLHSIGANAALTPDDVPLTVLQARGVRLLHLAGYFALPGFEANAGEPTKTMFREASRLGMLTSLDNVWDARDRWDIRDILPETDIFCPSVHDAKRITGRDTPPEIAAGLLRLGVRRCVALKMGAEGSFVMNATGESHLVPALSVQSVDGTGSGDAFIAGFLTGVLEDRSLLECARLGNAAGAMNVSALGAMTGITNRADLERMAQAQG